MEIRRDRYLRQLIAKQWNGKVKTITGIRRCGKSYVMQMKTHEEKANIARASL